MPKRVFTPQDKAKFKQFIIANRDKMSTQAIADTLGVAKITVATWLMKMGIKKRRIGQANKGRFSKQTGGRWRKGRIYYTFKKNGSICMYADGETHQLSRVVWEENYGPIAKGMVITYRDNNPRNLEPSNLEMITRQEHLNRHGINRYPREIRSLIQISARLKKKLNEQSKSSTTSAVQ